MKRLNPKTNDVFKRGDIREDGKIFYQYRLTVKTKDGYYGEYWCKPEKYFHTFYSRQNTERKNKATVRARGAKRRGEQLKRRPKWFKDFFKDQVKEVFEMARELEKIFPWKMHVDHVVPMQGKLVCGLDAPWNLEILPWIENIRKGNKFDVDAQQPPQLSEGYYFQGKVYTQLGPFPSPGPWENRNNANNSSGTVSGQDIDNSPQEGGGDSMAGGDKEMGTLKTSESFEDIGNPYPAPTSDKDRGRHLSCEFGEFGVVVRAGTLVQQSSDRRVESVQGPSNQEIQSAEEELKELPKTYNPDWYTNTTGYGRSVVPSGYLGPRHEVRNQLDEVPGQVSATRSDEPTHKSSL